jgi:hypothetical protein
MKKLSSLFLVLFSLFLFNPLKTLAVGIGTDGACGPSGGCPIVGSTDPVSCTPQTYDNNCKCDSGLVCAIDSTNAACACQKAFGANVNAIRSTAGLTSNSVPTIVGGIIKVLLGLSGTVALVFVVWGGIQWMTSKGDTTKISGARKLMISGVVGIAIIAAAYAITDFVIKQITVGVGA